MVRYALIAGFCLSLVWVIGKIPPPYVFDALVLSLGLPVLIGLGAGVALVIGALLTLFTRKTV